MFKRRSAPQAQDPILIDKNVVALACESGPEAVRQLNELHQKGAFKGSYGLLYAASAVSTGAEYGHISVLKWALTTFKQHRNIGFLIAAAGAAAEKANQAKALSWSARKLRGLSADNIKGAVDCALDISVNYRSPLAREAWEWLNRQLPKPRPAGKYPHSLG